MSYDRLGWRTWKPLERSRETLTNTIMKVRLLSSRCVALECAASEPDDKMQGCLTSESAL